MYTAAGGCYTCIRRPAIPFTYRVRDGFSPVGLSNAKLQRPEQTPLGAIHDDWVINWQATMKVF